MEFTVGKNDNCLLLQVFIACDDNAIQNERWYIKYTKMNSPISVTKNDCLKKFLSAKKNERNLYGWCM